MSKDDGGFVYPQDGDYINGEGITPEQAFKSAVEQVDNKERTDAG